MRGNAYKQIIAWKALPWSFIIQTFFLRKTYASLSHGRQPGLYLLYMLYLLSFKKHNRLCLAKKKTTNTTYTTYTTSDSLCFYESVTLDSLDNPQMSEVLTLLKKRHAINKHQLEFFSLHFNKGLSMFIRCSI